MSTPKRIQLRRTKGWRKPEGAVVVARPSRWGNPYPVARNSNELFIREDAVDLFRWSLLNGEAWWCHAHGATEARCVECGAGRHPDTHRFWEVEFTVEDVRAELAGHDLACWCPLDQPCHADVLLELANVPDELRELLS